MYCISPATVVEGNVHHQRERSQYSLSLERTSQLRVGSGLEEVFEEIYSEDTVKNIFSGKAVTRALRAHMLTQSA